MLIANTPNEAKELLHHPIVTNWHKYLESTAQTSKAPILLLVPCANRKPYTEGETESFFYRWLWRFIRKNNLRESIFICTISEPLAVIMESDYNKMPNYNISPNVIKENPEILSLYIDSLSPIIAKFLLRNKCNHDSILAYVRPDNTHQMFLENSLKFLDEDLIKFTLSMDDLINLKKDHRRMWHLNWMIFLEQRLEEVVNHCLCG